MLKNMFEIGLLIIMLSAGMLVAATAQIPPPLEPGVAQTLAKWRAAHYSNVRYKLNLTLEKGAPLMRGEIEIVVNLTDEGAKNDLVLDWRTTQFASDKDKPFADVVKVNDSVIKELPDSGNFAYLIDKEHIVIAKRLLKSGENIIKISFASPIKTSGAAVTRYVDKEDGAEYVYSLFVPSDASMAFPVFDQPDLKAVFQLNVIAPYGWKVITNSAEEDYSSLIEDENRKPVRQGFSFEKTKPISTYVFAFAAGDFAEFTGEKTIESEKVADGDASLETRRTALSRVAATNIYVRKSQAEKFKQHEKEVFRLNREAVKYLESYFDYKFPFPKYDLVLIPEFPFGGMEHAGSTFLREASIIFPSEPTKNDYISRANLIFHEAAHQWFGDTVTMKWFDDLWLKEGFAEFMAYKTLEKVMPEYNAWKAFYERNKPLAYLTDSTKGTTPIYQEIPNLSAAKSAYGNIVYRKAPSFLRQAEFYLGAEKFQTAVRAFLKKHQYANAEWIDLVREFETASDLKLKDWGEFWVKQPGLPKIQISRREKSEISYGFCAAQYDIFGNSRSWDLKIKVLESFDSGDNVTSDVELYRNPPKTVKNPVDKVLSTGGECLERTHENRKTKFIFPNYGDYGYGIFLLDKQSREYVLKNIQNEKDDFLRSMMWGSLWDSVREADLNPKDYVELAIKNIAVERDESTINAILARVGTALNYYLPDAERDRLAARLETVLTQRVASAETAGQRITFYRAYLNLASSARAAQNLKDILNGKSQLAVFQLRTKDKFDLVTRLLILGDKDAPQLLANLEKTETADDAKRYAYAARAATADADSKAKYFKDFMTNREISESWIESALPTFNSSRHADLTLPYLETALAELPNLKRTRKIFFVNGWLGAFSGGQKSAEALAVVNKFLANNQNLDKDLRLKILENVDGLERAVRIREKYGK